MHEYLVIAGERVHETHQLMPRGGVDQLVDVRQRERVLWTGLVEVCEVYADYPLPVLLFDYGHVGYPFLVLHLANEPCAEQAFDYR